MDICVYCKQGKRDGDSLNHVGARNNKPIATLLKQVSKLGLTDLAEKIKTEKEQKKAIYIHLSCRTEIKNRSRSAQNVAPARTTRSSCIDFSFEEQCFYCGEKCIEDSKNPNRKKYHEVLSVNSGIHHSTLEICKNRMDDHAKTVEMRLLNVVNLVACKARYHMKCRTMFENLTEDHQKPGRPKNMCMDEAFEAMCEKLENNDDNLLTLKDFAVGMEELGSGTYANKTIKAKLLSKYGSHVTFIERDGLSSLILLDVVQYLLANDWYTKARECKDEEKMRIVKMAAKILKSEIKKHPKTVETYPSPEDITHLLSQQVPQILLEFMKEFTKNELKQNSIAQAISACSQLNNVLSLQFGLAVSADNKFGSKLLNVMLNHLGFSSSYDEVIRFKQNVVRFEKADDVMKLMTGDFIQYVGDNTDHDINTIDGKNTHHGLGSIAVSNGRFGFDPTRRPCVPRMRRASWTTVPNNEGIPILDYGDTPSCLRVTHLRNLKSLEKHKPKSSNLLWICNKMLRNNVPNWAGFMSCFRSSRNNDESAVAMLPIIDLHATDYNALYSLLNFISKQCTRLGMPETAVTFDQPLYIKAYEIVNSKGFKIFVRLGGFHQLMSFLGSVGFVMEGSGLREALETVYAPNTVNHMLSGKAYARALRGHILTSSALMSMIIKGFIDNLSSSEVDRLLELASSEDLGVFDSDAVIQSLQLWFEKEKETLQAKSRTGSLWVSYVEYIFIILDFIRAERTSDWPAHVTASQRMLNLFASTGHYHYAKSCRLYVQSSHNLEHDFPNVYAHFMKGNHTVKRTKKQWSGISTDLAIEQILMKSLKGRSGVIGKGLTENVSRVWTKTMHRMAEFSDAMESLMRKEPVAHHQENLPGRIKRDNDDFQKVCSFFNKHNPFVIHDGLICLTSGLSDTKNDVNCDQAEDIGKLVQENMNDKMYSEVKSKKSDKVKNLQSLYSTVKVYGEKVDINPLALFLRLITVIERQPQIDIKSYFEYELTPFPMSMFKDGLMRTAAKHKLKDFLLTNVSPSEVEHEPSQTFTVMDGGSLLWLCNWRKGELYSQICQKYVDKCRNLHVDAVVFDGYVQSTKNQTRLKRGKTTLGSVEINNDIRSVSDRDTFLTNYSNKERFVKFLTPELVKAGVKVVQAPSDADTTIVRTALDHSTYKKNANKVVVMAEDTDILCLLLHHYQDLETPVDMFIKNVTCKSSSKSTSKKAVVCQTSARASPARPEYRIKDVLENTDEWVKEFVLFAHAYLGCDTTSAIYNLGKISIFEKLKKSQSLRNCARKFFDDDASPEIVGNASIEAFQVIYSDSKRNKIDELPQLRRQKYDEMVASKRKAIDPSVLPPTPRAAYYHGLRTFHQICVWRKLSQRDLDPSKWGWEVKNDSLSPVMTDKDAAPENMLNIIRCACKKGCGVRCSCRKAGLKCASACKSCHGVICNNACETEEVFHDEDEDNDINEILSNDVTV